MIRRKAAWCFSAISTLMYLLLEIKLITVHPLLLAIQAWIINPIVVVIILRVLWWRAKNPLQGALSTAFGLFILCSPIAASYGVKWWYDQKVVEMCAIDGGVKIYETAPLTRDLLDKYGQISLRDKAVAKLSDKYYYESGVYYFQKGSFELSRTRHQIMRRSDGKVLGDLVRYGRGGGDLPGPWHASSFMCPDPIKASNFESSVFINGEIQ